MRVTTTRVRDQDPSAPLADAGPYDYDLPVTRGVVQPAPAPRPAWKAAGLSLAEIAALFFISFGAPFLRDWTGWPPFRCYLVLYGVFAVLRHLSSPRPKQSFPRWALQMVGICLNCYVGLVTVPESLRGLLPEWLAFGLPAFLITAALYWVTPVRMNTGKRWPLWQWLLVAGWAAAFWVWLGPFAIE